MIAYGLGSRAWDPPEIEPEPNVVRIWSLDSHLDLLHLKDLAGAHTSLVEGLAWRSDNR